ncbi:MAG: hypothetical protein WBV18_15210 [Methyloceanibacter sp.]|jgi:hypothetical protein|uniref:hypothetical protein n=1 Tax=Methyloceanibacter sp. TaxID=1965321 RepID=UPI003C5E6765
MTGLSRLHMLVAILLCGAVGVAGTPALAKKKNGGETYTVQKMTKRAAAMNCRRSPVPPFMRNPRYMNRAFLKKKCPG